MLKTLQHLIKKSIILFGFLTIQYGNAQNISVSVVTDKIVLFMSGPTTVSNLSSSLNAGNDTLFITSQIGSGTLSLSGSPAGVSVDNSSKTIIVDLATFSTFAGIELIGSSSNDSVIIGSGGIDLSVVSASADQSIDFELGNGTDVVLVQNPMKSKGTGEISINVSKTIIVTADITSEYGGIYLTSNLQPTPTSGNFIGIDIAGNIQSDPTNGGEIYMEAIGGNSGNDNYGVYLHGGKTIQSGGSSATTITGIGGASTGDNNYGVFLHGANTSISATDGSVSVIGFGGGTGTSSSGNTGIVVHNTGASITNAGTGAGATVVINGYGGNGVNEGQIGVDIQSEISSSGGNIYIEAWGGASAGSFTSNIGLLMRSGGQIHAGGNATITAVGTATATQSSSDGIQMLDSARIYSDNGSISITGISHSNSFGITCTPDNSIISGNDQDISIVANKANLSPVAAGNGRIALFSTSGTDIDLGGNDGISAIGFSTSELDGLSCSILIIGDTTQSTLIEISDTVNTAAVSDGLELNTAGAIRFSDGILNLGGKFLNMSCNDVERIDGQLDVSDSSCSLVFMNSSPVELPQGLIYSSINDLQINGGGTLILGDSTTITGELALNNGDLSIGDQTLALHGTISSTAPSNSLLGSSSSKLVIGGDGASIGSLIFGAGTDSLHSLTLDRTGATGTNPVVSLGNDLTITNTLGLVKGKIALDSHMLTFTGINIIGGDSGSYVKINGSGGFKRPGGNSILFPVGFNPYLPVVLNCNSCSAMDFTVQVAQGVTDEFNAPIVTDVVNSTWTVVSSSNQTADLMLQWPVSAELTMPHVDITLGTRVSLLSPWSRIGSNMTVTGSDPFSITYNSFQFVSGAPNMFGIGGAASPLPVDLLSLNADCEAISWQASSESPNTSYDVQGSKDGKEWSSLGTIQAANNNAVINSYMLPLSKMQKDLQFFRLKTSSDGELELSHIVQSDCKSNESVYSLYPNPASDKVYVSGLSEGSVLKLYNVMGNLVYETVYDGSNGLINLADQQTGLYILYIDEQAFRLMKSE
jgi:hypothetical protein